MAEQSTLARPYAEALFGLARERKELDEWSAMLALMASVATDDRLVALAQDPRVARERFTRLFLDICGDRVDGDGENFVRLLQDNHRIALLPEVARQFEELKAEAEGSIDAEVVSAFEVEPSQLESISGALRRRLGREIHLTSRVDKSLIGGVIIRAGDLVIDGSVRGGLRNLANYLSR